jgi:O-antigen/teichoic acid export membrane protein
LKALPGSLIASGVILLSTAISGIISARVLGPHDRGVLAAVVLWPTAIAALGSVGMLDATSYFAASGRIDRRLVLGSAAAVLAALSLVLVVIGFPLVTTALAGYGPDAVRLGRYALVLVPTFLFGTAMGVTVLGAKRIALFNILRSIQPVGVLIGAVVLVAAGTGSVTGFATVIIAAYCVNGAAALVACMTTIGTRWQARMPVVREMLHYGTRSHLGYVSSTLNLQLGQMVMSLLLAPAALGLYAVAFSLASVVLFIPSAVVASTFPDMAADESVDKKELLGRSLRLTSALTASLAAPLLLGASIAVRVLFGDSYRAAVPIMQVLVVATLPLAVNMVLSVGLRALNRPLVASRAEIVSLGCTAVALPMLLASLGPVGAAAALLLAQLVMLTYLLRRLHGEFGWGARALVQPRRSDWMWVVAKWEAVRQ